MKDSRTFPRNVTLALAPLGFRFLHSKRWVRELDEVVHLVWFSKSNYSNVHYPEVYVIARDAFPGVDHTREQYAAIQDRLEHKKPPALNGFFSDPLAMDPDEAQQILGEHFAPQVEAFFAPFVTTEDVRNYVRETWPKGRATGRSVVIWAGFNIPSYDEL